MHKKDTCKCGASKDARVGQCRKCRGFGNGVRPQDQAPTHPQRTQQEILDRILFAVARGDEGDEFNEYMKQATFIPLCLRGVYEDVDEELWEDTETTKSIDRVAHKYLPFLIDAANRNIPRFNSILRQYKAWKWMLGHKDADTRFMGTSPKSIALYFKAQFESGQWEELTRQATKGPNIDEKAYHARSIEACAA